MIRASQRQLAATLLIATLFASAPAFAAIEAAKVPLLKGNVSETVSPIAEDGSKNELPVGLPVDLTLMVNLNSEITKVGDGVVAMVSMDVKDKDGKKVLLPGQWFVGGRVTEVSGQRRLGRDGYITIKFEKLVSPDNKYEIPIDVTATTRESKPKAIAKVVAKDSVIVTKGALMGSLASVQLTGIPLAIQTYGISVGAGAAAGATVGLIAGLKRKGQIKTTLQGEELKVRLDKPVVLPAFNANALPSAEGPKKVENLDFIISKAKLRPDPFGDKHSQLLQVDFKMDNKTDSEYCFSNIAIVSDHNQMYYPYLLGTSLAERQKRVRPNSVTSGSITFGVTGGKHKYWLVLLDRGNQKELARVPVN